MHEQWDGATPNFGVQILSHMASSNSEAPVLDTYQAVVSAYGDFLTVAIHTILYERNIYPQTSFIKAKKYNFPVRQNRHPKVCKWIQDAVAAVKAEMLKCTVARTSLIIHAPPPSSAPLERYVFSSASFPRIPPSEILTPFASSDPTSQPPPSSGPPHLQQPKDVPRFRPPPTSNLPEQFRATLARLTPSMSRLLPLPDDCSFTLAIELRDEAGVAPPFGGGKGHSESPWIAAEPELQSERSTGVDGEEVLSEEVFEGRRKKGVALGGVRTTPVRSLEAGAFAMEVWVEEGNGKMQARVEDDDDREGSDGERGGGE